LEKPRLIIHPGMPKTGTTAIQKFFFHNRAIFAKHRLIYPDDVLAKEEPSHWPFFKSIVDRDFARWDNAFNQALQRSLTLLFSSEAICSHLMDMRDNNFDLQALSDRFDVRIGLVIRDNRAFTKSLYKQCIANAPYTKSRSTAVNHYGTKLLFDEFVKSKWVEFLQSEEQVTTAFKQIFSEKIDLEIVRYNPANLIEQFSKQILGMRIKDVSQVRPNLSLPDFGTEALRQSNLHSVGSGLVLRTILRFAYPNTHNFWSFSLSQLTALDIQQYQSFRRKLEFIDNPPLHFSEEDMHDFLHKIDIEFEKIQTLLPFAKKK